MKKTMVLGASENTERYSNRAIRLLRENGHEVVAIGNKTGTVNDVEINTGTPEISNVDTVTLYLSPINQKSYYDYIIGLDPARVVFNPGTENPEFMKILRESGIDFEIACTLVLLNTGQY